MNVKHLSLATFAAALLMSATAFAADPHHGGGAPHGGGGAPHAGGGGAPHVGGGGMPHGGGGFAPGGGGFSHGGGGGFAHGGGGFSHGGGTASFSHTAPSHSFNRGAGESRDSFATFGRGAEVQRNTATIHSFGRARGLEAPRGSMAVTYTHAHGAAYAGMEHAAAGGGPQHYARDLRGFGTRPSNWNNRPRNFDRGSYQRNVSATERFRYGSYDRPSGWYYRRWSYGDYLPAAFWARDYWLTSWWLFDLAIPPYGYEWVRYGDDALLVNVYTGQILQVDYGVFY